MDTQDAGARSGDAGGAAPGDGSARTVRVTVARLEAWASLAPALAASLGDYELARVARMRFERDRILLTVAYGLQRLLVGAALEVLPGAVPMYRDGHGRPRVEGDPCYTSLSHAHGWVAVAIDPAAAVGVDVEPFARAAAADEVAASILHRSEHASLAKLADAARARALLTLWVRKEAVLKAAGVGLAVPMATFAFERAQPTRVPGVDGAWTVRDTDLDVPVCAAVAFEGNATIAWEIARPSMAGDERLASSSPS